MRRLLLIALLAAVTTALPTQAAPQAPRIDAQRERWEQKSPEERDLLRKRFAELQALAPDERAALTELAAKLKASEERVRDGLSQDVRARLHELPPHERDAMFREHFHDVLRRQGDEVRDRLPSDVLAQLEAEPPKRRPHKLKEILKHEYPLDARDVRRLGEECGVPREQLADLEDLDEAALQDRALSFHRAAIDARVAELGLPPGVDAAEYAKLGALPHREFFRRWRDLDPAQKYRPRRDGERRGGPGGSGKDHGFDGPPERLPLIRKTLRALEPTLEDRIELAGLAPEEKRAALAFRARERCLEQLERNGLLSAEQLAPLRAAEPGAFLEQVRTLLKFERRALKGPDHRDPRPEWPDRRSEHGGRPDSGPGRPAPGRDPDGGRVRRPLR